MLSIKCKTCGATNTFKEDEIPSFCSFCGAALPNMLPFVEEAIKISQERERHKMEMEKLDKTLRKEKAKKRSNFYEMIITVAVMGVMFYLFYKMFSFTR